MMKTTNGVSSDDCDKKNHVFEVPGKPERSLLARHLACRA